MSRLSISLLSLVVGAVATVAQAHFPDWANQPVRQRVDCIGPIGGNLPPSYRRVYNRPTDLGGKIAYLIAPTSQEAIAWHRAKHQNAYECDLPRQERYYFYPKPWESLQIGPRPARDSSGVSMPPTESYSVEMSGTEEIGMASPGVAVAMPIESPSLVDPLMLNDGE